MSLEPNPPPPHVVVIGRSLAAASIAAVSHALGWRATVVDDEASPDHPDGFAVFPSLDLRDLSVDKGTAIVVATLGRYDEAALEAALAVDAGYVGLIASRRGAAAARDYLRTRGFSDEVVNRVRAPAGLDLGEVDQREIGVAVLAELVALKATGELGPSSPSAPPRDEARDPVCGVTVRVTPSRLRSDFEGRAYFFCSARCRRQFDADPVRYSRA